MQQYTRRDEIALQIINLAKAEILLENPFLAQIMGHLTHAPLPLEKTLSASGEMVQFTTNGNALGFDTGAVLARFRISGGKSPKHDLLHSAIHCVFLHPFVGKTIDAGKWNVAADIAAEYAVAQVLGPRDEPQGPAIARALSWIEGQLGSAPTAEKIYQRLARGQWESMVPVWEALFASDAHRCWYASPDVDQGFSSGEDAQVEESATKNNEKGAENTSGDRTQATPCAPDSLQQGDESTLGENEAPQNEKPPKEDAPAKESGEGDEAPRPEDASDDSTAGEVQGEQGDQDSGRQADSAENRTSHQEIPEDDTLRRAADAQVSNAQCANGEAAQPGDEPAPAQAAARVRGEGAGAACEPYASQRSGDALRMMPASAANRAPCAFELRERWAHLASNLAVELQTYARDKASAFAGIMANLDQAVARPTDYRAFLRHFAALGEVVHASDEEFDYVFYTYGLRLYKKMPLVEPLEYREEKRIRQFVIVLDTSGSVQGDIVRKFADVTFDILKSTESFHRNVQVRIIQCDASVQSDDKITNVDDMRQWGRACKIRGGGGTDFRPAFSYVDSLIEQGELDDLGGLVYFTDGWGTYPEQMPSYRCAFVFYDEGYRAENVPPWVMQVVMSREALDRASF